MRGRRSMLKPNWRSGFAAGYSDLSGSILAVPPPLQLRSSDGAKPMKLNSSQANLIDVRPLTVENFRPYGC